MAPPQISFDQYRFAGNGLGSSPSLGPNAGHRGSIKNRVLLLLRRPIFQLALLISLLLYLTSSHYTTSTSLNTSASPDSRTIADTAYRTGAPPLRAQKGSYDSTDEGTPRAVGDYERHVAYAGGRKGGSVRIESEVNDARKGGRTSASGTDAAKRRKKIHVAIEEKAGHHNEVWPAFLHTLSLYPPSEVQISVFLAGGRARIDENGMGRMLSNINPDVAIQEWDALLPALAKSSSKQQGGATTTATPVSPETEAEEESLPISVLISTTCTSTLQAHNTELLALHASRPFRLVCGLHHTYYRDLDKITSLLKPWVTNHGLILFGLSEHTSRSIRHSLDDLGVNWAFGEDVSFSGTPVRTLVPVFPLPEGILTSPASSAARIGGGSAPGAMMAGGGANGDRVKEAVIQGSITRARRDYASIFAALEKAIRADPKLWGWTVPFAEEADSAALIEDPEVKDAFHLTLLGKMDDKPDLFPPALKNVIRIVSDVAYPEFYSTLNGAGLLLPALRGKDYYNYLASSSIAAAVIANVPILATRFMLSAYTYLDGRGVVLTPDNISPIQAIASLRTNGTTLPLAEHNRLLLSPSVQAEDLRAFSFPKQQNDGEELKLSIYEQNRAEMELVLWGRIPDFGI